jgi:hypothetical protein
MAAQDNWREILNNNFEQLTAAVGAYLPTLLTAALLIIAGVALAWISRWIILRLGQGADKLGQKLGLSRHYLNLRWPPSRVLAGIFYWLIILFFFTSAARTLGLPGINELVRRLVSRLPDILIAIVIIWAGFVLGAAVRERIAVALKSAEILHHAAYGNAVRVTIITLAAVVSLRQIGVNVQLIENALIVGLSAIALAAALAVGLGAGAVVTNIFVINQVKRIYAKGQRVKIDGIEGQIVEFIKSAVILDTADGRAMIPARTFQERASILLDEDDAL